MSTIFVDIEVSFDMTGFSTLEWHNGHQMKMKLAWLTSNCLLTDLNIQKFKILLYLFIQSFFVVSQQDDFFVNLLLLQLFGIIPYYYLFTLSKMSNIDTDTRLSMNVVG